MKRAWSHFALVLVGLVVVSSTTGAIARAQAPNQAPAQGQAGLRVAHMAPGAPPQVDVYVDGQRVAGPVAYQAASGLQNVAPGSHEVKVTAAGQTDPAALTVRQDMAANKTYTVVVTGGPGDLQPVMLEDDLTPAPDGRGRLRFVNAIPNTRVNVVTDSGDTLFQNVDYRATTDFREVPAGNYTLRVRDANTNTELTTISNVSVPSRGSAAAFATGTAQFGGAPVQQQPPTPQPAPSAGPRTGTGGGLATDEAAMPVLLGGLATAVALVVLSTGAIRQSARRRQERE